MDAVGKTMNLVESHYLGGHIAWDQSIDDASGTLGLLFYLRKGFEAQQKEESEWLSKRGKTSSDAAVEA
jgi:hypothetical protein